MRHKVVCVADKKSYSALSTFTQLKQLSQEAVNMVWEEEEAHRHAMTIGNGRKPTWWGV
jgi:hypothetical protein